MKKLFTLLMMLAFCINTYAVHTTNWAKQFQDQPEIQSLTPELSGMVLNDFLNMTPKKYKKLTGKKLGFKNTIKMKMAQKKMKKIMKKGAAGSGKSQLVALLLAIFVGGLGIHRFYLGYTTYGILQLITLGGCGIWALIDLIRIITGDLQPKNGSYSETL